MAELITLSEITLMMRCGEDGMMGTNGEMKGKKGMNDFEIGRFCSSAVVVTFSFKSNVPRHVAVPYTQESDLP